MSKSPIISIVLPVWNGQKYLAGAIESVLNQTYEDWELILVDDHSSDKTPEIVDSYIRRDSRIMGVRNSQNLRLPKSLNVGFSNSTGKYLTWISDDNLLLPTFLEYMLINIETLNCDFVYSDYWVIDEIGSRVKLAELGPLNNLAAENCIGAAFLYRSQVAEKVGDYDTSKFMYEDYDYWVRIRLMGFDMQKIDIPLYEYRVHGSQLSQTKSLPKNYLKYRLELPEKFLEKGVQFDRVITVRMIFFFLLRNHRMFEDLKSLKYLNMKNIPAFLKTIFIDLSQRILSK